LGAEFVQLLRKTYIILTRNVCVRAESGNGIAVPETLLANLYRHAHLRVAVFTDVTVETNPYAFRFPARKPLC
jgi:hypothetical protein